MRYSAFIIAFFATIVRYYDYAIFGLSASVLAKNFTPETDPNKQVLAFFSMFSIAMLARPLGSVIFGHIGDKFGRIKAIKTASIIASISTILVALVPNYNVIGITALMILTLARAIFLLSLAGEGDGIKIYLVEKLGSKNRNLANGSVTFCSQIGVLIASYLYYKMALKTDIDNSFQWWRLSFIFGGVAGLIIIILRTYFIETTEFLEAKKKQTANLNYFSIVKANLGKLLVATIVNGCIGGIYNFLIIFSNSFLFKIACVITNEENRLINFFSIMVYGFSALIAGYLADRGFGKSQTFFALLLSLGLTIFFKYHLNYHFIIALACLAPFYSIGLYTQMQLIFSVGIRMRLYSLSHSVGSVLISSFIPLLGMLIWQKFNSIENVIQICSLLLITLLTFCLYIYYKYLYRI